MVKFSYFLFFWIAGNQIDQGTGFFIKKDKNIYLVTAAHNFYTGPPFLNKTATTFYARVYGLDHEPIFIEINNDSIVSQIYNSLDFAVYKVSLPTNVIISFIDLESLEKEFNTIKEKKITPYRILAYGFPSDEKDNDPNHYLKYIKSAKFEGKLLLNYYQYPVTTEDDKVFKTEINNYFVTYVSDSLGHGMSGSPVFFADKDEKEWHFGGILIQRNELHKHATILRPERIIPILKNLP